MRQYISLLFPENALELRTIYFIFITARLESSSVKSAAENFICLALDTPGVWLNISILLKPAFFMGSGRGARARWVRKTPRPNEGRNLRTFCDFQRRLNLHFLLYLSPRQVNRWMSTNMCQQNHWIKKKSSLIFSYVKYCVQCLGIFKIVSISCLNSPKLSQWAMFMTKFVIVTFR